MADKLLVIEPRVKLTRKQIERIEAAGFVVVRGDPTAFHHVGDQQPIDQKVLTAALEAIRDVEGNCINSAQVRDFFGRRLARQLGYGEFVKLT